MVAEGETGSLTLRDIQEVELSVLGELDRICDGLGLRYCLAYGTLLGAMRHDGFIPWDDDVDVWMPRDDFERLIAAFRRGEVDSACYLQNYRLDDSFYGFAKLVDPHTRVVEHFVNQSSGLWVDVFPLERVARDDPRVAEADREVARLRRKRAIALSDPRHGTTPVARLAKLVLQPYARTLDARRLTAEADQILLGLNVGPEVPEAEVRYVSLAQGTLATDDFAPDDLFPLGRHAFEGRQLPVPAHPDAILTYRYGDWRKIPPPEERPASHFRSVVRLEG